MSREEAINVIKGARQYLTVGNPIWNVKKVDEAMNMAIEALSAEEAVWNEYEAEFTDLPDIPRYYYEKVVGKMAHEINTLKGQLESAETHEIRTETHGVCSDLISRADALMELNGVCSNWQDDAKVADIIHALPSAEAVPQLRQTDTLIIADALRYLAKDTERHLVDRTRADALRQQFLKYGASMCKGGAE